MFAGAGAARHRGSPKGTAREADIYFDGGITARVENLARRYFADRCRSHKPEVPRREQARL
jgi:hypothetical protein